MRTVLLLCAALFLLTGCSGFKFRSPIVKNSDEHRAAPGKLMPSEVQSEVMTFADTFNACVSEAWNKAASGQADDEKASRARRAALEGKLAIINASLSIASSPNPHVALADMITMVTLERMVLEGDRTKQVFGEENAESLVKVFREQEDRLWDIAGKAMTDQQQEELQRLIVEWREAHPDSTYVAGIRLQDFAREREQTLVSDQASGSLLSLLALDPLAGLDPAQRDLEKSRMLGERMFFYSTRLPQVLKWQVESLYQGLFTTPEFRQLMVSVSSTAETMPRLAAVAEDLPKNVAKERRDTIEQAFDKLGKEREATINAVFDRLSKERAATLEQIDQKQDKLQVTLKELQQTADTTNALAMNLKTTIEAAHQFADRVMPAPGTPSDPEHNSITQFRDAMEQTGLTADRLTQLAQNLDKLATERTPPENQTKLQGAAAELKVSSRSVVDYAFNRALMLVLVTPISIALAALGYRLATRRMKG